MDSIISIKNASYTYPDSERPVLDDISFEIERGQWVAIVGHNGSGKSTLAKAIDGLLKLDSGSITVDDQRLDEESVWQVRSKIGFVFQNPDNQFVGATVADDVAFGLENRNVKHEAMVKAVKEALVQVHMEEFSNREPAGLSGGQKQRVALAGVIAMRPQVVILDEATSMLDPEGRTEILELLRDLKQQYHFTVLSITHSIDETALADRIVMIDDGQLIESGSPAEVLANGDELVRRGLELPYPEQLKRQLNQVGVNAPANYMNQSQVVEWLCQQLNLNK